MCNFKEFSSARNIAPLWYSYLSRPENFSKMQNTEETWWKAFCVLSLDHWCWTNASIWLYLTGIDQGTMRFILNVTFDSAFGTSRYFPILPDTSRYFSIHLICNSAFLHWVLRYQVPFQLWHSQLSVRRDQRDLQQNARSTILSITKSNLIQKNIASHRKDSFLLSRKKSNLHWKIKSQKVESSKPKRLPPALHFQQQDTTCWPKCWISIAHMVGMESQKKNSDEVLSASQITNLLLWFICRGQSRVLIGGEWMMKICRNTNGHFVPPKLFRMLCTTP